MSEEIEIIGYSYLDLIRKTKMYACKGFPVLFEGPTGVGKELFARLYARQTEREIIPVHFATLTHETIESQLFGHKRGSFTGANRDEIGLIKSTEGNVLFLDEIGLASPAVQASLLRVVEYGDYRPLGGTKSEKVTNARFVAATNMPGSVSPALRQRFHTLEVHPPKDSDILKLIRHYFSRFSSVKCITEGALVRLYFYPWPGNIREIKTTINETMANKQAAYRGSLDTVAADHLPQKLLDVKFSDLGRYSESENRVPIDEINDWIWTRFPFRVEFHRQKMVEDESPVKESKDELPRQPVVEKAQKRAERFGLEEEKNPFGIMSELPRAQALEESEKRYYLKNAANPHIKTQKALAKKMHMSESHLSKRLKRLGIQDEIKMLLLGRH